MGILVRIAMAGKMFAAGNDAACAQPVSPGRADLDHAPWIGAEGAVADDWVRRVGVDIEHRREIEVDAEPSEFLGGGPAETSGELGVALCADLRRGGKMAEGRGQTMDPAAFLVDGDEGRRVGRHLP